ncbi:sigma-70 family RNA polymerase sigma factor [Kitasatospora sp. GAS204B]|uniref:sigma-70 family RNA polymerase sigma factor n=1 Tax=unclassified Kitasatospora TaxID=2633591 RepID=UPI00247501C7|nr:sigma-70 family RNA polymerase sigma factor [Kitasatospora sp. GAS204B]
MDVDVDVDAGAVCGDLKDVPDARLLDLVRAGGRDAYGELFRRHHRTALRYARGVSRSPDEAFDLTAEAFTRILQTLARGSGPSTSFVPYLLTTIRRIAVEAGRAAAQTYPVADVPERECAPAASADVLALFEYATVLRAFGTLPERWRTVLWRTEVHGEEPARVAETLGLSPNAVSALAYRAREGLRRAYLTQHVRQGRQRCRRFVERFGAHARGALSEESSRGQEQHLRECGECRVAFAEVRHVERTLHAGVVPVLVGAVGLFRGGGGLVRQVWQFGCDVVGGCGQLVNMVTDLGPLAGLMAWAGRLGTGVVLVAATALGLNSPPDLELDTPVAPAVCASPAVPVAAAPKGCGSIRPPLAPQAAIRGPVPPLGRP